MYGQGINSEGEILDYGHILGLVEKSGAFFKIDGETIGQGKVKPSMYLKEKAKIREGLLKEIRDAYIASKAKSTK
jgi:recombination protein RecA